MYIYIFIILFLFGRLVVNVINRLNIVDNQLWQYCSMASPLTSELIAAAKEGNQERCQQLLSQGADVNGANEVSREVERQCVNSSYELYSCCPSPFFLLSLCVC